MTVEQILAEMGITPIWRLRAAVPTGLPGEPAAAAPVTPSATSAASAAPASKAVAVDALNWPDLAAAVGGRLVAGDASAGLGAVSIDSRTLGPGDLFFAIAAALEIDGRYQVKHDLFRETAAMWIY